jgi:hypothetical protein
MATGNSSGDMETGAAEGWNRLAELLAGVER